MVINTIIYFIFDIKETQTSWETKFGGMNDEIVKIQVRIMVIQIFITVQLTSYVARAPSGRKSFGKLVSGFTDSIKLKTKAEQSKATYLHLPISTIHNCFFL